MTRLANIALAIGLVLAGSADWAISPIHICAIDRASCEAALRAARSGWVFRDIDPRLLRSCEPAPGCRPENEDYIPGYNAPR